MRRLVFVMMVSTLLCDLARAEPAHIQRVPIQHGLEAQVEPDGKHFVSVAFHDVVDRQEELESDGVTSDRLVRFFDWLKGDGWTSITLDDVDAARRGERRLPDRAILLTFDDGYRSIYTRVFPLLLAYRFHAVIGLVGSWMDAPPGGTVLYGTVKVPRDKFLHWNEVRGMVATGLVEVASHSYAMHDGVLANPQGNQIAAAMTWRYDPASSRYETDAEHRARIRIDLERARRQIARELGKPPRALIWPFGRYSGLAELAARDAGFRFGITLEPEPADATRPMEIARYFPTRDPRLGEIAQNLRFAPPRPATIRLACIHLDRMLAAGAERRDEILGELIEDIRLLGANTVLIEAGRSGPGGDLEQVYFPSRLLPMAADLLSRAVWQLRSRGGVEVFVHLDQAAVTRAAGAVRMPEMFADMLRASAADGLAVNAPGAIIADPALSGSVWAVRARRAATNVAALEPQSRSALTAFRAAQAIEPRLRLMLLAPEASVSGPPAFADALLLPPPADAGQGSALARHLHDAGWFDPLLAGRVVLSLPRGAEPGEEAAALVAAQTRGAAGFALCPSVKPVPPGLARWFSAATFPLIP